MTPHHAHCANCGALLDESETYTSAIYRGVVCSSCSDQEPEDMRMDARLDRVGRQIIATDDWQQWIIHFLVVMEYNLDSNPTARSEWLTSLETLRTAIDQRLAENIWP